MFDPDRLLDPLTQEIEKSIARVRKAKTPDARLKESEILLNLGKTMDVFLRFTQGLLAGDGLDLSDLIDLEDEDEDDTPF
jgi:hypothetical protein